MLVISPAVQRLLWQRVIVRRQGGHHKKKLHTQLQARGSEPARGAGSGRWNCLTLG